MKKLLLMLFSCLWLGLWAQDNTQYIVIGAKDVNLREEPNSKSNAIAKVQLGDLGKVLEEGSVLEAISGTTEDTRCNQFYWYKVQVGDKSGWIYGAFVFHVEQSSWVASSKNNAYVLTAGAQAFGADMCTGRNFLSVVKGEVETAKKAIPIKVVGVNDYKGYRGLLEMGFDMNVFVSLEDKNGKIIISSGGYAPGEYGEIAVWELSYNAAENVYEAKQKLMTSNY